MSPRFWTIVLPIVLTTTPAMASRNQSDMSNDCFDVAAPMAEATPCFEPSHHARRHSVKQDRNLVRKATRKSMRSSDGTGNNPVK